jgi:hypothetical protein
LLTDDGLHVPVMLFEEVVGSEGTPPPEHIVSAVPKLNVGVIFGFTVTLKLAVSAHCPPDGVKV